MRIGIQISSNLEKRTGVEEYIYQLLKHLSMVDDYKNHQFFILAPSKVGGLPVKILKWPFKWGWTQVRLSWEMSKSPVDVLFVPAHTYPLIHPKKIVVAIQGLEFEAVPKTYGFIKRKVLRFLTKRNAKKAEKIIVPSQTTKNDLIKFYKINPEKIFVIFHGVAKKPKTLNQAGILTHKPLIKPYLLYLGSGHKRKNIEGLKKAFRILKEKYKIPHELLIFGLTKSKYVDENKKWELLQDADIFIYPSFYEGFGFPVLEAQVVGTPVVASNTSSLPEMLGNSALLVNPNNPQEIAEAIYKIIMDPKLKEDLIKKGYENIKRFSWERCAQETLKVITTL